MSYIGDFPLGATISHIFSTHNAAGANVAPLSAFEDADLRIYKGTSAAQKTTANGVSLAANSPFDSIVGLHAISIDTSNATGDAGFWDVNSEYSVCLIPDTETIDSQVVNAKLFSFSIQRDTPYTVSGSVIAGSGATVPTTISFATSTTSIASKADGFWVNSDVLFTSGALKGKAFRCKSFITSNDLITTADTMPVAPTAGDTFVFVSRQTA